MKPERIFLMLVESHHGHPHRHALETVLFRVMGNECPTDDDIGVLIQGFAMHPVLDTMDLQELLDWLNERFDGSWTTTGR